MSLNQAAKTARGLVHQFRALAEVGEALDALGDLEAKEKEYQDRKLAAESALGVAIAERDAAVAGALVANEALARKQAEVEGVVPAAQAEAERVRAAADLYSRQSRKTAEDNARQLRESVAAEVVIEENRLVGVRAEIERLTKQRDDLKAEIDRLRQKFGG